MLEFQIAGETYRAGKLDAFAQLHVSRKLAPILPKLLPAAFRIFDANKKGTFGALMEGMRAAANGETADPGAASTQEAGLRLGVDAVDAFVAAIEPVAQVLASMPDTDAEYVYATCLAVVSRRQPQGWASIWSKDGGGCMFDDIDLVVMTQIVMRVVMDSLGGFIGGWLEKTAGGPSTTAASTGRT